MLSKQLLSLVCTAITGGMGIWGVNALAAVQPGPKNILTAAILVATLLTMARIGGVL